VDPRASPYPWRREESLAGAGNGNNPLVVQPLLSFQFNFNHKLFVHSIFDEL
jgi:hypothetical protein